MEVQRKIFDSEIIGIVVPERDGVTAQRCLKLYQENFFSKPNYSRFGFATLDDYLAQHSELVLRFGPHGRTYFPKLVAEAADIQQMIVKQKKKKRPSRAMSAMSFRPGARGRGGLRSSPRGNLYFLDTAAKSRSPVFASVPSSRFRPGSSADKLNKSTTFTDGSGATQRVAIQPPKKPQRPQSAMVTRSVSRIGSVFSPKPLASIPVQATAASESSAELPSIAKLFENLVQMLVERYPDSILLVQLGTEYTKVYKVNIDPMKLFSKSWQTLVKTVFKSKLELEDENTNPKVSLTKDYVKLMNLKKKVIAPVVARSAAQPQTSNVSDSFLHPISSDRVKSIYLPNSPATPPLLNEPVDSSRFNFNIFAPTAKMPTAKTTQKTSTSSIEFGRTNSEGQVIPSRPTLSSVLEEKAPEVELKTTWKPREEWSPPSGLYTVRSETPEDENTDVARPISTKWRTTPQPAVSASPQPFVFGKVSTNEKNVSPPVPISSRLTVPSTASADSVKDGLLRRPPTASMMISNMLNKARDHNILVDQKREQVKRASDSVPNGLIHTMNSKPSNVTLPPKSKPMPLPPAAAALHLQNNLKDRVEYKVPELKKKTEDPRFFLKTEDWKPLVSDKTEPTSDTPALTASIGAMSIGEKKTTVKCSATLTFGRSYNLPKQRDEIFTQSRLIEFAKESGSITTTKKEEDGVSKGRLALPPKTKTINNPNGAKSIDMPHSYYKVSYYGAAGDASQVECVVRDSVPAKISNPVPAKPSIAAKDFEMALGLDMSDGSDF